MSTRTAHPGDFVTYTRAGCACTRMQLVISLVGKEGKGKTKGTITGTNLGRSFACNITRNEAAPFIHF